MADVPTNLDWLNETIEETLDPDLPIVMRTIIYGIFGPRESLDGIFWTKYSLTRIAVTTLSRPFS